MCQGGGEMGHPGRISEVVDLTKSKPLVGTLMVIACAGAVIAAGVLLARSDEIGEWLQVAATNVMPNAAMGAAELRKAIEQARTCIEETGLNVCLDAEGQVTALYTFISQWYLSPKQHVIEMAGSIFLLAPLVYAYYRVCGARVRVQRARLTLNVKRSPQLMKLWGVLLICCVIMGTFLKFSRKQLASHPAYIWQPCHVHSLVMGLCSFFATEWSLLVMHVATTLWWGPFLAFIAPSLPNDPLEIVIFWVQHTLMLMAPIFRLTIGGQWMYRDFWWNSVGYLFLTCYHWWWLAPVNIVTGVNVATMTVPPESLAIFGKWYRFLWGLMCILLQAMAVVVVCAVARLSGQWPPASRAFRRGKGANGSSHKVATSSALPPDTMRISQGQAVSFVDGVESEGDH